MTTKKCLQILPSDPWRTKSRPTGNLGSESRLTATTCEALYPWAACVIFLVLSFLFCRKGRHYLSHGLSEPVYRKHLTQCLAHSEPFLSTKIGRRSPCLVCLQLVGTPGWILPARANSTLHSETSRVLTRGSAVPSVLPLPESQE